MLHLLLLFCFVRYHSRGEIVRVQIAFSRTHKHMYCPAPFSHSGIIACTPTEEVSPGRYRWAPKRRLVPGGIGDCRQKRLVLGGNGGRRQKRLVLGGIGERRQKRLVLGGIGGRRLGKSLDSFRA